MNEANEIISTFSIAALDPETNSLGVAVQSKFLAVGAVVPWAKAGIGAVATQAMANYNYGPQGLELMAGGSSAEEAVEALTNADPDREHRQIGVVDASGSAATFTGGECFEWAGGIAGEGYVAQGNILVGKETVGAMAEVFEGTGGGLAHRLLAALDAGQKAGGDARGRQSAALLIAREGGGYGGDNDREIDLRVDDHPEPIDELIRLRNLHKLYFGGTKDVVAVEGDIKEEVAAHLDRLGHLDPKDESGSALLDALSHFVRTENFEEREQRRGYIDIAVLEYMRRG